MFIKEENVRDTDRRKGREEARYVRSGMNKWEGALALESEDNEFSSQLCYLTVWPLPCNLTFIRFLLYHARIISSKECLNDMMWMKSLGLRKVYGIYVSWNYSGTKPRDQAHDISGEKGSQEVSLFRCSQPSLHFQALKSHGTFFVSTGDYTVPPCDKILISPAC